MKKRIVKKIKNTYMKGLWYKGAHAEQLSDRIVAVVANLPQSVAHSLTLETISNGRSYKEHPAIIGWAVKQVDCSWVFIINKNCPLKVENVKVEYE